MNSDSRGLTRLLYDPKARGIFFQILAIVLLVGSVLWIVGNTVSNLGRQGKSSGFDFLGNVAGFDILTTLGTSVVGYTVGVSTYLDVFWVGVINTLVVSVLGIIGATLLGFMLGIFRLSSNIVLRGFATVYVEIIRNVPLLLQLFFWYFFVLRALPGIREQATLFGGAAGINITGLYMPLPLPLEGSWIVVIAFLAALALWWGFGRWARQRQEKTGQQTEVFWTGLGFVTVLTVLAYFAGGSPFEMQYPVFTETGPVFRRGYQSEFGLVIKPEMLAVWLALVLYTASFIAEIVRAGILAVPRGQMEAALAAALRPGLALRLVILPQALRVIIPPLTSQFLNLIKNSSLAVAIAYPDVVSIFAGTALNQVGREIEMIAMMMLVYLVFSLLTSILMNWFNARMRLVER